jgi:hypothetical protein
MSVSRLMQMGAAGFVAPKFVASNAARNVTSWSISGTSSTDLLLMAWQTPTTGGSAPSNLTRIASDTSGQFEGGVSYGSNTTSGTLATSNSKYVVLAFSGADTSSAPSITTAEGSGATTASTPSMSGFITGRDMVVIGCITDTQQTPEYSGTDYTEVPDTSNGNVQMAYKVASSTTESPSAFTLTANSHYMTFIAKVTPY